MNKQKTGFAAFAQKMRSEDLPEVVIQTFEHYYRQLQSGESGLIPENEIVPLESIPDAETLPKSLATVGEAAMPRTVVLKLNGGLGTSMGLEKAKSLLMIRDGYSFLDIIARQNQVRKVPLLLMNSYSTREDSLRVMEKYRDSTTAGSIPVDFVQHKVPKVNRADLGPARWPDDPTLEWCPPGHGDIYTALLTSGMLETLLARGYKYLFVSNADNLGAVIDESILGYFVDQHLPFMMEAADRTEADKKGGHLACRPDGQLILRESAQCPPGDEEAFQSTHRHRYFNTNNLWINLVDLQRLMTRKNNNLELAMILNAKTVNPRDKTSTPVYQVETAMGAAIAVFEGAGAIRVPRSRFAAIKTNNDLLDVRSDNYVLSEDFQVVPNTRRHLEKLVVDLDPDFYQLIDDLEARFPFGAPSLLACERLTVRGDIRFGRNITLEGDAQLVNETGLQVTIEDNSVIRGRWQV